MKLWLTRCYGGRYILTALKPTITQIRGLKGPNGETISDAFERPGEPIAVRYLCEGGIRSLFGKDFPLLQPVKIDLTAKEIEKINEKDVDDGPNI